MPTIIVITNKEYIYFLEGYSTTAVNHQTLTNSGVILIDNNCPSCLKTCIKVPFEKVSKYLKAVKVINLVG